MANLKLPSFSFEKLSGAQDKFDGKKICVITGTSSGLGKSTTKWLLETGNWHIICAVRDIDKMNVVAEVEGFDMKSLTIMQLDLASFQSVRDFSANLIEFKAGKPIDRLVCNAAIYQPSLAEAKWTEDGHEQQLQVNHLSHFLLSSLLIPEMKEAEDPRLIMVGSVTGNDNTVGGGGVYPIADLKDLDGLKQGGKQPVAMIDGFNFNGAKAYKDTKMCLMMTANTLHDRFHRSTGVAFSAIYPGCIAESPLFREKRPWFRKFFPVFMKYVTGGFVGEPEAGQRLGQVVADPRCSKSGVYWSWNGGPRQGRGVEALKNGGNIVGAGGAGGDWESIYENDQSDRVRDPETMALLWQYSNEITGAVWPLSKQPISPCPTLKFISFVTSIVEGKEALERKQKLGKEAPKTMKDLMENLAV
eukprot:CAMPEP_0119040424 /NCGR_PEP_ID=MMETSP1177-20130426/10342_1 /TAXON_ID=2985 /ORGANISM="Ochromonas sp, Strain CCMP1899" /LENGTH=415 /DNA_ID=CAMNT_0007005455 /DNA_START=169 /DNA_END=1416 /DNA_ORIENTATION=-